MKNVRKQERVILLVYIVCLHNVYCKIDTREMSCIVLDQHQADVLSKSQNSL